MKHCFVTYILSEFYFVHLYKLAATFLFEQILYLICHSKLVISLLIYGTASMLPSSDMHAHITDCARKRTGFPRISKLCFVKFLSFSSMISDVAKTYEKIIYYV